MLAVLVLLFTYSVLGVMWEPAQSIADSEVVDMSCHAGAADFFWKPEAAGSRASREVMSTSVHVRCRSWLATEGV